MSTEVIGRERELVVAESFLDNLKAGASAMLLEGEPGIGKTAIWRAIAGEAGRRGYRVLSCQSEQAEANLSFVGLSDLLATAADEVLPNLPRAQRQALELALLREAPSERSVPEPRALAVGFTSLLAAIALEQPVVVAVDDLQWLDAPTARMLAFALRRLDGSPVGLIATLRTPSSAPDPLGLERSLGAEQFARLRLGPLGLETMRTLLSTRLGREYTRPVLLRIMETSGGNPLFALEIARALGPGHEVDPGAPLPVPDSLREFVALRISGLGPGTREALLAAAALAHPKAELVERASSATGLAAAEEAGLVRVIEGRVVFGHPLYASGVYGAAAASRRRELHQRLAQMVDDREEQARHLALAAEGPDEQVAAVLESAAPRARARGAWESAGELLERARALTPPHRTDDARRRGVQAAEHYVHAGDRARGRALLEEILAEVPPGPARSDALRLLAEIHQNEENYQEARELFEEALELTDNQRLAVAIELGLTFVGAQLWDFPGAAAHATRALERATAIGDDALVGEALGCCAMIDFLSGLGVDWSKIARAVALEDPGLIAPLQRRPSVVAALLLLYVGRLSEARERLTALCARARERGDESDLAFLFHFLALLETAAGDFTSAAAFAEEADVLARLTGSPTTGVWVLAVRGLIHAHLGDVTEARRDCAEATALAERADSATPVPWIVAARALLETSLGDAGGAWRAAEPLTNVAELHGITEPFGFPFIPDAIGALVDLGQLDRAESLLDSFERRGQELDQVWALATGARCRGLLLAACGDAEAAEGALEEALVHHSRLEMPFELARTLLVQGRIRRRRREKRSAKESLEQALALFEQMGARLWANQARAELSRLGLRKAPNELTATEERVAALAGAGKTAKEIAAALFVSPKTVQANLARIYEKLGVRSRAELGARMAHQAEAPAGPALTPATEPPPQAA